MGKVLGNSLAGSNNGMLDRLKTDINKIYVNDAQPDERKNTKKYHFTFKHILSRNHCCRFENTFRVIMQYIYSINLE